MPLQVDHARPVRTVDTRGNVVGTESNLSAPIKVVDSVGRAVHEDAKSVAEQAAAVNPEVPKESPKDGEKAQEGKEKEPTASEVRKAWLQSQKVLRGAQEKEKRVAAAAARAEAFEKVRTLAESGEDPVALLKAAGLDPVKYYQHLTKYALSDKGKQVEDPVQRELRLHKERLDKYEKDLEVTATTLKEREDLQIKNQIISEKVIPLLRDNSERYECLLAEYGPNAAVEVFKTVWDIYEQTGKARSFSEVADEMENYWQETIGRGVEAAAKLKKFQNRFTQAGNGSSQTPTEPEIPKRSVTLSNKPSAIQTSFQPKLPQRKRLTWEERAAEILKKFPD